MNQRLENMKTLAKKRQEASPAPPALDCSYCHKPVAVEWNYGCWFQPDIHDHCRAYLARMRSIGLDQRFWGERQFQTDPGNKDALGAVERFLDPIANPSPTRGLYLFGEAGTGKTHLAAKIAKETHLVTKFVKVPALLMNLRANFDGRNSHNQEIIDNLSAIPLLILDDLGAEKASDWVAETLYLIIDNRYGNLKPTVITSNFSLTDIGQRLGDRIASRIAEMCEIIKITSPDRRLTWNCQR